MLTVINRKSVGSVAIIGLETGIGESIIYFIGVYCVPVAFGKCMDPFLFPQQQIKNKG